MSSSTNTNNVNKTRGALVLFTLFVSVGGVFVLFTLFVFVGGALVLFTLFVFVEELMSCLRYVCL
jgi:hypothetical protein